MKKSFRILSIILALAILMPCAVSEDPAVTAATPAPAIEKAAEAPKAVESEPPKAAAESEPSKETGSEASDQGNSPAETPSGESAPVSETEKPSADPTAESTPDSGTAAEPSAAQGDESTQTPETEAPADTEESPVPETAAEGEDIEELPDIAELNGPSDTVESIIPKKRSVVIGLKETISIADWTTVPEDAVTTVTYTSRAPKYASVTSDGKLTGNKLGKTTIVLTAENGTQATIAVTVKAAPKSVKMRVPRTVIAVGEKLQSTYTLSAKSAGTCIFYDDPENDTLTIDPETGLITAQKPGTEYVYVQTYNGKQSGGTIKVTDAVDTVTFRKSEVKVAVGDSLINPYLLNEIDEEYPLRNGAEGIFRFESSDPSVLSVDEKTGRIKARAVSESAVTVTAHRYDGIDFSYRAYTVPAPTGLSLSVTSLFSSDIHSLTLGIGETARIDAAIYPEGSVSSLSYASSRKNTASVSGSGVITAKRAGKTVITVKTFNGKKATLKVTVVKKPASISLRASRTLLALGETAALTVSLPKKTAGAYVLSDESGNNAVTINSAVKAVTAAEIGEEAVTATLYTGAVSSLNFTVVNKPDGITIKDTVTRMPEKSSVTLGYTLTCAGDESYPLANGAAGMATWAVTASSEEGVAAVDANTGVLKAYKPGTVEVTATTYDGGAVSAPVSIEIAPLPTNMSFDVVSALNNTVQRTTMYVGEQAIVNAVLTPEDAMCTYTYTSKYPKIASVNAQGLITAKKAGSTVITVKTSNGIKRTKTVKVVAAPKSFKLNAGRTELGLGESICLNDRVPAAFRGLCVFSCEPENGVLTIDEMSGEITTLGLGTATVTVTAFNGLKTSVDLTVAPAPEAISIGITPDVLAVGQYFTLSTTFTPEDAVSPVTWSGDPEGIVTVDADNVLTAQEAGTVTLTASTFVEGVSDSVSLTVYPAPDAVWFDESEVTLRIDAAEPLKLEPHITEGSLTVFDWSVRSGSAYISLSDEGAVTPLYQGDSVVRVSTHNGKYADITIHVYDPYMPTSASWVVTPPVSLRDGETFTPEYTVLPDTAITDITWKSSEPLTASVDPVTGVVTAISYGRVTITGTFNRNPALKLVYTFTVLTDERELSMPRRRLTNVDTANTVKLKASISTIKAEIEAVRKSAVRELEDLNLSGTISASDYSTRKAIIDRAFAMYSFPWGTTVEQGYWRAANSEGGAKNFKPKTVYFGLPYTQTNRTYNNTKALNEQRYVSKSTIPSNMYLLNRSKLLNGTYCGNDCSAFVSMANWGVGASHSADTTRAIGGNTVYKTISDKSALRPGDMLNWHGHHVVMFLYYANKSKTQAVILQQGGSEAGINTISATIVTLSDYWSNGYKIRRLSKLP